MWSLPPIKLSPAVLHFQPPKRRACVIPTVSRASLSPRGNGVQTGQCVQFSTNMKTCEVFSWCPLEIDAQPPKSAILAAAENFTVLIKNSIMYPKFNFHRRNILPHIGSSYLKSCEYNQETDPECPIFQLKYMVSEAGEDFQDMAVKGGVLGIFIDWSCNLDWPQGNKCHPEYTFRRLDNKNPLNDVATGLNFRFAKYYQTPDGKETRTLIKAYGIRFNVIVFGTAGKFGIVPTIINLAAALALLSLVPPVTDWVMLTCMRKRDLYKRHKVSLLLEDTDAESVLSMGPNYGTQK
ncbi:hypothetical protein fugu_004237 [Takifugu bimaculatus]|uniref:Uncharacterized protein n=1 Tax=Takifugu bimaculatus TaxID=433685 RepID=A0A4Z2BCD4_9TELE|nr:hypothetical protein fugu_004237 [Takifugu bimaculatus]